MKQTFIVAFKIEVEAGSLPLDTQDVLLDVQCMTDTGGVGDISSHYVGELKKDAGWNKNIDVSFQLWLEERCKGMWP